MITRWVWPSEQYLEPKLCNKQLVILFLSPQTGRSRGFAFVYFSDVEDAVDVS